MFLHGEPKKTYGNSNYVNRLSRLDRRFGIDLINECESEVLIKKLTINDDPLMDITFKRNSVCYAIFYLNLRIKTAWFAIF